VKVVFDTNVYVSALTLPQGSAARALDRIVAGEHELFLSRPILEELLAVLALKFARDREELARVALLLSELAVMVPSKARLRVLDDAADNRILECGLSARVDAIVTGDKKMLKLAAFRGVRVITLREFLEI